MDILSMPREDIVRLLEDRIRAEYPTLNIVEGSPIYDLMVNRLSEAITSERELVNIITNIARVAPMFNDEGRLRSEYQGMEAFITERFFLDEETTAEVWDTVYLRFNKKGRITVLPGSVINFDVTELQLAPTVITNDSPLWIQDGNTYLHPVQVRVDDLDDALFLPATTAWVTGGVEIQTNVPLLFVLGAWSKRAINTFERPRLTFQEVRNSITNRSFSNIRSIQFNLRNNSIFTPDELIRAKVMHIADPAFIERRKILYEDSGKALSAVVSGHGKVLLDYGNQINRADVTMEYVERDHPLYAEIDPVMIFHNTDDMLRNIQIDGLTDGNTDGGRLYGFMNYEFDISESETKVMLTWYRVPYAAGDTPDPFYAVLHGEVVIYGSDYGDIINVRMELAELNGSGLSGWCVLSVNPEYFAIHEIPAFFRVKSDLFSLYRIDTTLLGLLSPISLGSQEDMEELQAYMESTEVADLVPPFSKSSASLPGTSVLVRGDAQSQIDSVTFMPADLSSASLAWGQLMTGNLFWRITENTAVPAKYILISLDKTFRNPALLLTKTLIPETYVTGEVLTLEVQDNAFMTLDLRFTKDYVDIVPDISPDNYLASSYSFVRVANNELVLKANTAGMAANNADGLVCSLLYYGTNRDALIRSQEAFANIRKIEAGHMMTVSPMRPIVFTLFYTPEYIAPYLADRDYTGTPKGEELNERLGELQSRYVDLVEFLTEYFSTYSGRIGDIDFTELANLAYEASGLHIKKLDYTLFTQRGHRINGHLKLQENRDVHLSWETVVKNIKDHVNDITDYTQKYIPEIELEYQVTEESLYKPVFSKVWV